MCGTGLVLLSLLLGAPVRAAGVDYDLDPFQSAFDGDVSMTVNIETYGDSNSTGSGSGGGGVASLRQVCQDYAPRPAVNWLCADNLALVDWGAPAWSSLGVEVGVLEGFLEVQDSAGDIPVSVNIPTGLPIVPSITINGTADLELNAIRVTALDVPAAVFDLLAEDDPDPSSTDPGPGPWSALMPTLTRFEIDWCADYSVAGTAAASRAA